jgi:hypothetical protein
MEEMKINSKTGYNRDRVMNDQGPHNLLKMVQQKLAAKIARESATETSSDLH